MGASESSESPKVGYHVLQVQPTSPGEKAGLTAFFDFIVSAQGVALTREDSQFVDILKANIGKEVNLVVYNVKSETTREAILIPSATWGGSGLAGISIRFCSFEKTTENVWHVLEVYPDSPASVAGLESRTDYIVGTFDVLFNDSEDFFALVENSEGKDLSLYIYSTNTDNVRIVVITPNRQWGGSGSLGCDIGFGYLHRIPLNRNIPHPSDSAKPSPPVFQSKVPTNPTQLPTTAPSSADSPAPSPPVVPPAASRDQTQSTGESQPPVTSPSQETTTPQEAVPSSGPVPDMNAPFIPMGFDENLQQGIYPPSSPTNMPEVN